jgi:hypothetical protein
MPLLDPPTELSYHDSRRLQEHLDRELASQLQQEELEDSAYIYRSEWVQPDQHTPAATFETSNSPDDQIEVPSETVATPITHRHPNNAGTRDDPIDLRDSSDDDLELVEDYIRIQQELDDAEYARALEAEENRISQEAPTPVRECTVCGEPVQVQDFPSLASCAHGPEICADCYASWIESELDSKRWDQIKCPANSCGVIVQHQDVQQYAALEVYQRWVAYQKHWNETITLCQIR